MKASIILCLVLLTGLLCPGYIHQEPEPVLTFTAKVHDFGTVPQDTLLTAKFPFTNTGNAPLIIRKVNPECLCTGYTLSKDTIQPKESAYIELQLNTSGKYGYYKIYTIVSANTRAELNKLTLKVNVE